MGRMGRILRKTPWGRMGVGLLLLVVAWCGWGVSGDDAAVYKAFGDAVVRWQHNPDFRQITGEYAQLSNDALRTHPLFIPAPDLIMALRKLPFLPRELAAEESSQPHYDNFRLGPLSAYLHLSMEQGLAANCDRLEALVSGGLSDERCKEFLEGFHIKPPVVTDAGAIDSVRRLAIDVQANRPFAIRSLKPADWASRPGYTLLHPHVERIAARYGYPGDPRQMTPNQQQVVMALLDAELEAVDRELWRTKQVNDFLSGIWAQSYGQPYTTALAVTLGIRGPCRLVSLAALVAVAASMAHRRWLARPSRAAAAQPLRQSPQTPTA